MAIDTIKVARSAACVLCLALGGCQKIAREVVDEGVGPLIDAAIPQIGEAFVDAINKVFAPAAASRAALGMACGSHNACTSETPLAEDACESEADTWQPDFREAFDACLVDGGKKEDCFALAVDAHEPTSEETKRADRCRGTILSCGTKTDACEALTVLADHEIVDAISACRDKGCAGLAQCFAGAFVPGEDSDLRDQCENK